MPQVAPATLNDLPKAERAKAQRLMFERAVLQYRFSFEKLLEHMSEEDLQQCVIAWGEDEEKKVKADLNDQLLTIFTNNGIDRTLRFEDPFGRPKDYMAYEGTSTSFSQGRAMPLLVAGVFNWECPECDTQNYTVSVVNVHCANPKCKHFRHTDQDLKDKKKKLVLQPIKKVKAERFAMPAECVKAAFEAATVTSKYPTFQARDVKEGK